MLWYFVVSAMNNVDFKIFEFTGSTGSTLIPNFWKSNNQNSVDQENSEDVTYILLTGRGGGSHDAPNLTDTIILAGINNKYETITLFSIPRDLYVGYPWSAKEWKINRIYEAFLPKWSDFAMGKLKEKIGEITGKNIDYYMNVDFDGFKEVVDALGWVEITLEENFVDYEFPDENLWYRPFILRKWTWTLDGEVALMYARSRHSTSDFDRSLRQQQIISSLREKLWGLWYFKDRKTILELYNIFNGFVETNMSLPQMVSLGLSIKWWEQTKTLSFNLNDSCYDWSPACSTGGLLYVPLREYFAGASVLLPNEATYLSLWEYEEFNDFSSFIFNASDIYTHPKDIVIYNTTRVPLYAWALASKLRPYGFSIDAENGTQTLREKKFENSILYYNGIDTDDSTLLALEKYFDIEMQKVESPVYSDENTRIEIILADDDSF
jgi:LCP family protein required for cell wall assembly